MNDFFAVGIHEHTAKLAFEYWERRGRPLGSPEIDWSAAEKALASSRGNSEEDSSLNSLRLEANEKAESTELLGGDK